MPFFYKVLDYFYVDDENNRTEWLNKVSFTIADFILICYRKQTNYKKKRC